MENHGPVHLEQASEESIKGLNLDLPRNALNDLSVYLYHLSNACSMAYEVRNLLLNANRPGVLCWYGDHVPTMPRVYEHIGHPDGATEYFIWQSDNKKNRQVQQDIHVSQLASYCMQHIAEDVNKNIAN